MNKIFEIRKLQYHKFMKSKINAENLNKFFVYNLMYDKGKIKEKLDRYLVTSPDPDDQQFEKGLTIFIKKVQTEDKSLITGDISYNIAVYIV